MSAPKIDLAILGTGHRKTTSSITTLTLAFAEPIAALPLIKSNSRKGIYFLSRFGLNPKPELGEDQLGRQCSTGLLPPPPNQSFQKHRAHPPSLHWRYGSINMPDDFSPRDAHRPPIRESLLGYTPPLTTKEKWPIQPRHPQLASHPTNRTRVLHNPKIHHIAPNLQKSIKPIQHRGACEQIIFARLCATQSDQFSGQFDYGIFTGEDTVRRRFIRHHRGRK